MRFSILKDKKIDLLNILTLDQVAGHCSYCTDTCIQRMMYTG